MRKLVKTKAEDKNGIVDMSDMVIVSETKYIYTNPC